MTIVSVATDIPLILKTATRLNMLKLINFTKHWLQSSSNLQQGPLSD